MRPAPGSRTQELIRKAVSLATRAAGLDKTATPHPLRRSFTTELIQSGCDIRTVPELRHKDAATTMLN